MDFEKTNRLLHRMNIETYATTDWCLVLVVCAASLNQSLNFELLQLEMIVVHPIPRTDFRHSLT